VTDPARIAAEWSNAGFIRPHGGKFAGPLSHKCGVPGSDHDITRCGGKLERRIHPAASYNSPPSIRALLSYMTASAGVIQHNTVRPRFSGRCRISAASLHSFGICNSLNVSRSLECHSLKSSKVGKESAPDNICLACGLCCDGTIFADVKLLPNEDATRLLSLGMPLLPLMAKKNASQPIRNRGGWKFLQPCSALHGCRCQIYGSRPSYCRQFECLLFQQVQSGEAAKVEALRLIRLARRRAEEVRMLLRALGNCDEKLSTGDRFRATVARFERIQVDPNQAELLGRLTIAFHKLNLILSKHFTGHLSE
jgi:Fe-S-cluster containining protein